MKERTRERKQTKINLHLKTNIKDHPHTHHHHPALKHLIDLIINILILKFEIEMVRKFVSRKNNFQSTFTNLIIIMNWFKHK